MDENLNSVDAELGSVVESQPEVESTTDVSAEPVEQQVEKPKVQTPEENAQFKALRLEEKQRAITEAENKTYETLAAKNRLTKIDGSPIKTKADWEEWESTAQQMDALILQGKTQEEALEKIEADRAKAELAQIRQRQSEQERINREASDFVAYFEQINGRKFTPEDRAEIESSGILDRAATEGIPLKYVYADYNATKRREKDVSLATGKKTAEVNALNATTSTGSVIGGGAPDNSVLTEEMVSNMSPKQIAARWPDVKKLYNMK